MPARFATRLMLGAAITFEACSSPSSSTATLPDCVGSVVTVTVSPGPSPRFAWQPACAIVDLAVYESANPVWEVNTETQGASFGPPIRYGAPPPHSLTVVPPQVLQVGHGYYVVVTWLDPQLPPGSVGTGAVATFVQ
jgi:hypothetical protein